MNMKRILAVLVAAAALPACASMSSAPAKVSDGVVTGPNGMTLYTFDKDPVGTGNSVCNDKCAGLWPPFYAAEDAHGSGDYTVITRDDGKKQWALRGKAALLLDEGPETGRQERRWRQQGMAGRQTLSAS